MLNLTRKKDQTIVVGHGLVVFTVKRITGNSVTVSVDAPSELSINRGEVELRLKDEERTDAA